MPAPPAAVGTDEQIWDQVVGFLKRWLTLSDESYYDVIAAWILLSWRYVDMESQSVPLLRFAGKSGSGKTDALKCVHNLSFLSRWFRFTPDNLHRVANAWPDGVFMVDEFHLDRGRDKASNERQGDQASSSCDALAHEARFNGRTGEVDIISMHCMWAAGGYRADESENLARRGLVIPTKKVPEARGLKKFPPKFFQQAEDLRSQLLTWRFRHVTDIEPDSQESELSKRLDAAVGTMIGQAFWPLVLMVPAGRPEALDRILKYGTARRKLVNESVEHGEAAHILSIVAEMISEGRDVLQVGPVVIVPVTWLVPKVREQFWGKTSREINAEMKEAAGLKKKQITVPTLERQRAKQRGLALRFDGYEIDLSADSPHRAKLAEHGVQLPTLEEVVMEIELVRAKYPAEPQPQPVEQKDLGTQPASPL
jgi:hypothetical protein